MSEEHAAAYDPRTIPSGATETMWRAADGFELRRFDWPAGDQKKGQEQADRGSILFMPGRGDAYEKYLESFEYWHSRGWNITAADWRGQAGSGRLGNDNVTGHIDDFAVWIADLATFWSLWAEEREGPLVLVGHSMGGHLVLRALAEKALSPRPDASILSAPLLGVHPQYVPLIIQILVAKIMSMLGDPRRPAWKWSEKPGEVPLYRQALLTRDDRRYADELWWRENRPQLVMGPGSWGWVASAMRSIAKLDRRGTLEQVDVPTLLLGAIDDKLVGPRAIRRAARRVAGAQLLEFGSEAVHELLREVDSVRDPALAEIDEFLEKNAPRRSS